MKEGNLRIAVIGAGAIGGITAALLSRKGHDVEIVCKYQETADLVQSKGLHVSGLLGEFYAKTAAVKEIADIKDKKDLVFIATKVNDAVAAARQIRPFLGEKALVVSLQNGIIEDQVADVVGQDRVIGCVVGWSATRIGPADMVFTRVGNFIVGDLFGLGYKKVAMVADILNDAVQTNIARNIRGELFSKLIINCCINALSAVTGLNVGPMLDLKPVRDVFISIMAEAVAVADALGIELVPMMGGGLEFHAFLRDHDAVSCQKRDDFLVFLGKQAWDVKPSSLQSLEGGRVTETRWLNGYIVERAAMLGVPVPTNQGICNLIGRIEQGDLTMTPDNLGRI